MEEIRNLVIYLITTSNWLCLNNCETEYPRGEDYCLIHHIQKRFLNCYRPWMSKFEKKYSFEDFLKIRNWKLTILSRAFILPGNIQKYEKQMSLSLIL